MSRWVIRRAQSSDRALVRSLFEQVFGPWPGDSFWDWKYSQGAHGIALAWLLQDSDSGEALAHVGARVGLGRAPWGASTIAQVMDVMVHPQARGRNIFEQLLTQGLHELYRLDRNLFVFGFAGLRPFRLGARLGFYRGIRAHFSIPAQHPTDGAKLPPLGPEHIEPLLAHPPALGFYATPAYLTWRFLDHPTHHYRWLPSWDGDQMSGSVVLERQNNQLWSVSTSLQEPDTRVWRWHSEPLLDKGFGALAPEPMMVSGQITLPQLCAADRLHNFSFEPSQTDVF
jgi:hypothetical protein